MGSKSLYLSQKLLDYIFRQNSVTSFTTSADLYVGLWSQTLTDNSTGSSVGEISGNSYERLHLTSSDWTGTTPLETNKYTVTNKTSKSFPTATGTWGLITHVAILDASTEGNILFWGALSSVKTIDTGDTFTFTIGDLKIVED